MLHYFTAWRHAGVVALLLQLSSFSVACTVCKTTPRSLSWPSPHEWKALNQTLGGRLLKPAPPAAVCHSDQRTFNKAVCINTNWTSASTYTDDPVGILSPNWGNDSCLPQSQYPCTGEGIPIYVVNATCAEHVAAGVDFAREHDIRLNVKGSGHDYLGRSIAPNSLSIWTKHIRGIDIQYAFRPQQCHSCEPLPAVTLGAGEDWGDIYRALHARNLTAVGGTGDTIGLGGCLTGGGHSPLSAKFGLAVDQVLDVQVVMASGEIVTANEVLHPDLFWAMRGGGGATFGIMTSVTLKTFPELPIASLSVTIVAAKPNSNAFWAAITYIVSQAPQLQEKGIMGYSYLSPAYPVDGAIAGGYIGQLLLPGGSVSEAQEAINAIQKTLAGIPGVKSSFAATQLPSLYAWYETNKNTQPVGQNSAVGNRLLDAKALSNLTTLRAAMERATPSGTLANLNLIAGPGLWDARPAGGSNSVTPAWRIAYVEYAIPVFWPPLNETAKEYQTHLLTDVYMQALRQLAPDTGSYLNEGDVNEPDFQKEYWGDNYPRLLSIKRSVDPYDVF